MEDIGLNDIQVGQRVKVKGASRKSGTFEALEVELKPAKDHETIEGLLQAVDMEGRALSIMGQQMNLPDGVIVTSLGGERAALADLKAKSVVKLVGQYSESTGFVPEAIRMKATLAFNIEKLQGAVEQINVEEKTLRVLGFTVRLNDRTVIEGF